MTTEGYLIHPELFASIPLTEQHAKHTLNKRVAETLTDESNNDPNISLVIRTLNEATRLEQLFEDIHRQLFSSEVEVIVVDNDSTDKTRQVAHYYGAEVVSLSRDDFTYPRSLNLGMEVSSNDVVFLTVGHARLSNFYNLHAGARHFNCDDVAGIFGSTLPNDNASHVENLTAAVKSPWLLRPTHRIKKTGVGVLAATGAMIAKPAWHELGRFDERYETGGEDTALAGLMLNRGYGVINEPALTVHHSHGLGLIDSTKQLLGWQQTLKAPRQFDRQALLARRPDLRATEH